MQGFGRVRLPVVTLAAMELHPTRGRGCKVHDRTPHAKMRTKTGEEKQNVNRTTPTPEAASRTRGSPSKPRQLSSTRGGAKSLAYPKTPFFIIPHNRTSFPAVS
jgi:hypothetical protein